jgi:hypothetical protein
MSNIQPYRPQSAIGRSGRALARLSTDTSIAVAVTEARAEVEAAKVDGIAAVGAKALQDVAMISQIEQSLAQIVPHASGRLATVADLAALSMADVVANAGRRMGRPQC